MSRPAAGWHPRSPVAFYGGLGAVASLLLFVAGWLVIPLPWWALWLAAWGIVTFALYGYDKTQARRDAGRVPELVLHGMALAGGVIGGWLGRTAFRHKTLHRSFLIVLAGASLLWGALVVWQILG
jgi:uncharacterized membrane protein YsdA (DUF1294 family)